MPNYGRWSATSIGATPLFTVDKAPGQHPQFPMGAAGTDMGLQIDVTLTGAETFTMTLTPLDAPEKAFTGSGSLANTGSGAIDGIEFMHWASPTPVPDPNAYDTDFFIRSLEVTGDAPAESADFDNDGDVDGADFLAWQRGLGTITGATPAMGNADGDGDVDANDLAIWKQQYDSGGGSGPPAGAVIAAVPEPTAFSAAAIALGSLALAALSRRK